jgi:Leucine-rich repeat (LRR) protein
MIGNLKNLRTLTLSHNQLTAIPDGYTGIGGCAQLAEMWLKGNPLKRLPPELRTLANLRVLLMP